MTFDVKTVDKWSLAIRNESFMLWLEEAIALIERIPDLTYVNSTNAGICLGDSKGTKELFQEILSFLRERTA